ncbi:MAG: hypothetical protein JOZ01_05210 [Candidatus Eremiobacteraeota bacterium]|nr:hypothetical protein [Candidatus Eremiobacteraeota bacterium]
MQRIFGIIATALLTVSPLVAQAQPHRDAPARADRPAATERPAAAVRAPAPERAAPRTYARPVKARPVEARPAETRPVVRERNVAPRTYARPVEARPVESRPVEARPAIRERYMAPRVYARPVEPRHAIVREPRLEARPIQARPVIRERFAAPRAAAPRVERRSNFVRYYYPRAYVNAPVHRAHVAFRRYVPQRIFVAPPIQVVRTYAAQPLYVGTASIPVSYVYSGYAPAYGSYPTVTTYYSAPSMPPLPLDIAWNPASYAYGYNGDGDGDENGYYNNYPSYGYGANPYGQYASYPQYPYGSQNPYPPQYGSYGQYGMAPFGNAQLQGVVIGSTGSGILVMTPSLKPVFVNTSIAQQNGYVNGNIQPGSFVDVFGYDTGNEFIATAIG